MRTLSTTTKSSPGALQLEKVHACARVLARVRTRAHTHTHTHTHTSNEDLAQAKKKKKIQLYIKMIIHHGQVEFVIEMQNCSIFENHTI